MWWVSTHGDSPHGVSSLERENSLFSRNYGGCLLAAGRSGERWANGFLTLGAERRYCNVHRLPTPVEAKQGSLSDRYLQRQPCRHVDWAGKGCKRESEEGKKSSREESERGLRSKTSVAFGQGDATIACTSLQPHCHHKKAEMGSILLNRAGQGGGALRCRYERESRSVHGC